MSITTVVITAARNTKPPKTPKAITAPRFNFAWCVLLVWSALSTLKGPDGSGTPVPMPTWALSTPLPEISLSWGWSLLSSFRDGDGAGAGLCRPMLGFLEMVSRTVAGSSAVLGTFRGGVTVVVIVVAVETVVLRTRGGRNVCRVLDVVGRTVIRGGTVTVVRGSSAINEFTCSRLTSFFVSVSGLPLLSTRITLYLSFVRRFSSVKDILQRLVWFFL